MHDITAKCYDRITICVPAGSLVHIFSLRARTVFAYRLVGLLFCVLLAT